MSPEDRVHIETEADIINARQMGRDMAGGLGFSGTDLTMIATAVSELARNIVEYARSGDISFKLVSHNSRRGVAIVAHDEGPGISDIDQALRDGYSTGAGLGLGLPGVRRLMDEFEIASEIGRGTTVTVTKWRQ